MININLNCQEIQFLFYFINVCNAILIKTECVLRISSYNERKYIFFLFLDIFTERRSFINTYYIPYSLIVVVF